MKLTNGHRKYYEYHHGRAGYFDTNLFDLIASADDDNIDKLLQVFPDEVEAYLQNKDGSFTLHDIEMQLARERVQHLKEEDENGR